MKYNAVFEGGGVRGIGHVGAAYVLETANYQIHRFVGSSAGAIVASLMACGYSAEELVDIVGNLDYLKFRHEHFWSKLGIPGKVVSLATKFGIYDADYFEKWLADLLKQKGKETFGDLKGSSCGIPKLQVTASDITDQRLLIFPRDLELFGIDADCFSIAKAVRMSMSIPLYYKPYRLKDTDGGYHVIVDGGMLSNYPIWIFDREPGLTSYPTIGFKFFDQDHTLDACNQKPFSSDFICYLKMLVSTALDGADKHHISESKGDFARTIQIPVSVTKNGKEKKISATDFDLTKEESALLLQNGVEAAKQFLSSWDFERWKKQYCS